MYEQDFLEQERTTYYLVYEQQQEPRRVDPLVLVYCELKTKFNYQVTFKLLKT